MTSKSIYKSLVIKDMIWHSCFLTYSSILYIDTHFNDLVPTGEFLELQLNLNILLYQHLLLLFFRKIKYLLIRRTLINKKIPSSKMAHLARLLCHIINLSMKMSHPQFKCFVFSYFLMSYYIIH